MATSPRRPLIVRTLLETEQIRLRIKALEAPRGAQPSRDGYVRRAHVGARDFYLTYRTSPNRGAPRYDVYGKLSTSGQRRASYGCGSRRGHPG